MKQTDHYLLGIRLALVTLWVYAAVSKLEDTTGFAAQLLSQPLPAWLGRQLVWALPASELAAAGLLVYRRSMRLGLWFSFGLLLLFSGYVGLAVLGIWEELPCACGGILRQLGWGEHLVFNLLFTLLAAYGLSLYKKTT